MHYQGVKLWKPALNTVQAFAAGSTPALCRPALFTLRAGCWQPGGTLTWRVLSGEQHEVGMRFHSLPEFRHKQLAVVIQQPAAM